VEVAAEIVKTMDGAGLQRLVLGGDTTIVPFLVEALPPRVRDALVLTEPIDMRTPLREIADAVWPQVIAAARWERCREVSTIAGRALGNDEALSGLDDVLGQLRIGRVDTVAFNPGAAGDQGSEEILREAVLHGSRILIERRAAALEQAGGVAATLR
jgi:hypothetical protein